MLRRRTLLRGGIVIARESLSLCAGDASLDGLRALFTSQLL